MSDNIYISHSQVTRIRLIYEEGVGSEGPWALDGADDAGGFTEAIACFATRKDALAAVPAFRHRINAAESIPVVEL